MPPNSRAKPARSAHQGISVAVTGPTGDLGIAVVDALERSRGVNSVVGVARSPFDPASQGWRKTDYRQGDVTDRASVRDAVKGADVVIHLAFSIMGEGDQTRAINVDGSRTVFEEAAKAGAERIVYASSVAAYGFHDDFPDLIDEAIPARGSPEHEYSSHKAEVERVLAEVLARRSTRAWVLRPPIIAGPRAFNLLQELPYMRLSEAMPDVVRSLLSSMPMLKPVLPDTGHAFQLIHEDDCARAFVASALGRGEPGAYNVAAEGAVTFSDVAEDLGWYSVRLPEITLDAAAEVIARVPAAPTAITWVHALRRSALLDTSKARRLLRWRPTRTSRETLAELVAGWRAEGEHAR